MTTDNIAQIINIFKTQDEKEKDKATFLRVLRENEQAERVLNETMAPPTGPTNEPVDGPTTPQTNTTTTYPPREIEEYPEMDIGTLQGTPITNPGDNPNSSQQSANTRYQCKVQTITQEYLFHLMDMSFLPQQQFFTNKQASSRNYPLQFLCDFAYLVIDDETGDLLEYRCLLKHPKYKDVWSQSFGKEI